MAITIRHFVDSDYADWRLLWSGYLTFYGQTLDDSITEATWSKLIAPDGAIHGFLATEKSDRPVGFVHYLFHPVTWSARERCYLEDLFVAKHARGQDAGKDLIEAVYAAADKAGVDQVYWLTEDSNETAQRLYDKVGRRTSFIKYQR